MGKFVLMAAIVLLLTACGNDKPVVYSESGISSVKCYSASGLIYSGEGVVRIYDSRIIIRHTDGRKTAINADCIVRNY